MAGNSTNQNRRSSSAQENETETDQDRDRESQSRFSAATLTRFAAVGLFVILGTFAVIHSMTGKDSQDQKQAQAADGDDGDAAQQSTAGANDFATGLSENPKETTDENDEQPESGSESKDGSKLDPKKIALIPDLGLKAVASFIERSGFGSPPPQPFSSTDKLNENKPKQLAKTEVPKRSDSDFNRFSAPKSEPSKPNTNAMTPPPSKEFSQGTNQAKTSRSVLPEVASVNLPGSRKNELSAMPVTGGPLKATVPPPSMDGSSERENLASKPLVAIPKIDVVNKPDREVGQSPSIKKPIASPTSIIEDPGVRLAQLPGSNIPGGSSGFKSGPPQVDQSSSVPPPQIDSTRPRIPNMGAATSDFSSRANQMGANVRQQFSVKTEQAKQAIEQSADTLQAAARGSTGSMSSSLRTPPPSPTGVSRPSIRVDNNAFSNAAPPPAMNQSFGNGASRPSVNSVQVPSSAIPSNSPFARKQVGGGTSGQTTGNRFDAPSLPSKAASTDRSLVRSKAPELPSATTTQEKSFNQRVPAMQASTSRNLASPAATKLPAFGSTSATSNTASNVPGERELEGLQMPAISLQKLSPREVQVNQTAEFQIVVKNVGRTSVDDVKIFDRVPDGTRFEGATPNPTDSAQGQLRWDLGTLKPGAEKRISLQLKPTRTGEIGSVAQYTFAAKSSVRTRVTQPKLEITHQTKPVALIGDDVIINVTIKNNGDGPARNVLIQEDIPKQLEFSNRFREIEYEVGTLAPGQSKSTRLALKAKEAGRLTNTIVATADGGWQAKHDLNMEVVAPKLKLRTDGATRRYLGRNVTHDFQISNGGTAPATNVEIIAKLPSGVRFVSANNQGTYKPSTHSVYWSLARLDQGADAGVELKTTPIAIGNHPIKVETFADLGLRDQAEQPLSIEHLVDVFFDIDDVVDPIEIGSETQYRLKIVNQGSKTATNIQIQVAFPNGLKPKSVSGPLTHNISGQQIQFQPIASLKPGESVALTVSGQGTAEGDHRIAVKLQSDDRPTPVVKEESTRVYSDR
ncbi:MAG: hypothetical protein AAFN77_07970 [Planctomycetota bacterium]